MKNNRGSITLVVLILLAAAGVLVSTVIASAVSTRKTISDIQKNIQARALARSGLEFARCGAVSKSRPVFSRTLADGRDLISVSVEKKGDRFIVISTGRCGTREFSLSEEMIREKE